MEILQAKKIHFVGISGIGISGLAKICLALKKEVTGSDLAESIVTEGLRKSGAKIMIGKQKESNVPVDIDMLVYSNAVQADNPERKAAEKRQVIQWSYPQALSQLTQNKKLICVSGTHGKTTTTAMIVTILRQAGYDPSFIVGSYLPEIGGNAYWGKSEYFVLEADEYSRAMLRYYPDYIVLTNLELDHLDTYEDLLDIIATFKKYVKNLSQSGVLIANAEDKNIKVVAKACPAKTVYYGLNHGHYQARNISQKIKETDFQVDDFTFTVYVPGLHNVYNALAAITLVAVFGLNQEVIKKGLTHFKGTWRRFENIGDYAGIPVISDYAHHPTEIKALLSATKQAYPDKRIVIAFQPHQHNRTKNLFKEFVECFDQADSIILNEIFEVAGRENTTDQSVSGKDLVKSISKRKKKIVYSPDLRKLEQLIKKEIKKGDILLIVGAGDIYKVGERLVSL